MVEARMVQGIRIEVIEVIEVVKVILGRCAKDNILRGHQTVVDQGKDLLIDQSEAAYTYQQKIKGNQGKIKDRLHLNNQDNLMVAGQGK